MRRERPDHSDGEGDDQDAPHGVVRQPRERGQAADHRQDHAYRSCPHRAGEQREAGEHDHDPQDQMDPAPR